MTATNEIRQPRRRSGRLIGFIAIIGALSALPAMTATPGLSEETGDVIATVNGNPITLGDMISTAGDLEIALRDYAPADHTAVVLEFLINQKLMAAAAEQDGIQDTPAFTQRMALVRERELRDAYFEKVVRNSIGEDEIKEAYAKVAEQASQKSEVHASHILVETKEAAEAIIMELDEGADFAELAKQKSIGPSGKNGGDLGFFGEADMAPAFFQTALALEPGEVSQPVQTDFGWHVIKVAGKRPATAPPLEAVRVEIDRFLVRQKFLSVITDLKAAAKIEIVEEPAPEGAAPEAPATPEAPAAQ